jgi:hypothetical protein
MFPPRICFRANVQRVGSTRLSMFLPSTPVLLARRLPVTTRLAERVHRFQGPVALELAPACRATSRGADIRRAIDTRATMGRSHRWTRREPVDVASDQLVRVGAHQRRDRASPARVLQ